MYKIKMYCIILMLVFPLFIGCKKESQGMLNTMLLFITSCPGEGEMEDVKKLIKKGADLECVGDYYEMTPLLNAAYGKGERCEGISFENEEKAKEVHNENEVESIKIVKFLIEKGANTKATDPKGSNALHLAVYAGRSRMAAALLELGFNINTENKAGATPIIVAASSGSLETVKMLVARGADINHVTSENASALDIAEQYGHADIAQYLENLGVKRSFNR